MGPTLLNATIWAERLFSVRAPFADIELIKLFLGHGADVSYIRQARLVAARLLTIMVRDGDTETQRNVAAAAKILLDAVCGWTLHQPSFSAISTLFGPS